jgi:hypothetical protein
MAEKIQMAAKHKFSILIFSAILFFLQQFVFFLIFFMIPTSEIYH